MNWIAVVLQISPKLSTKLVRAYFTEIKRPALSKSALFEKKKLFLDLKQKCQKQLLVGELDFQLLFWIIQFKSTFARQRCPFVEAKGPFSRTI